jgi:metal-responsive CopG/Arc/MetJ family transcriptional regulator
MSKVKTAISIENQLLDQTNDLAKELDISRSQVFALAIEKFIQQHRNKKLLAQINNVYAEELDSEDMENMEIMRSHQRKIMEHDEWK